MKDSTRKFLVEMDVPRNFSGFELLGEVLDMMVELMSQGRRIHLGDICEQLGKEHGMTSIAADRAMRRCIDGVVRQSYKFPNPMLDEVMGGSYRWMCSLRTFLFSCASWLLSHEDVEE